MEKLHSGHYLARNSQSSKSLKTFACCFSVDDTETNQQMAAKVVKVGRTYSNSRLMCGDFFFLIFLRS